MNGLTPYADDYIILSFIVGFIVAQTFTVCTSIFLLTLARTIYKFIKKL